MTTTSRTTRTPRRIIVAITLVLLALGAVAPAGAEPARAAPPPGREARCDLRDPNLSEHDEWGRCITVSATLSGAPSQGESATLSYTVRSAVPRPDAEVTVELPDSLSFVDLPAGASTSRVKGSRIPATRATSRRDLAPAGVERFSTPVRAEAAGPVEIVVRVSAPRPDGGIDGADDRVFLTVGRRGSPSRFGADTRTVFGTAPAAAAVPATADKARPHRPVPNDRPVPAAQARASAGRASLTTVCISGGWSYVDEQGVARQAPNFPVRVFDVDTASGNDLLAYGFTNGIGAFNLCYDNTDTDEGGLVDPAMNFVTSNSRWRVRNTPTANRTYEFMKPNSQDQAANISLGNLKPDDPSGMRAVQAFDAVNQFWRWLPSSCWDANDAAAACRQIVINWTPTSTDGTYYSLTGNDVHLAAADPDSRHTVIHEATHAVMDDVYEDAYPDHSNCSPHFIEKFSSPGCAWTEGFAEWVPASVLEDPTYRFPNGGFVPLETPTWDTPNWDISLGVEGRVAGAMIDLEDIQNEGILDRWAEGGPPRPQWTTFLNGTAPTYYVHFEYDRRLQGFDVSDRARASVFQNTINMAFYDPLTDGAPLLRPTPVPHAFHVDTTAARWSAVALRGPFASNYDLDLYDSRSEVGFLESSRAAAGVPDYVMVDSHRRPLGDYYPRVSATTGTGSYQVEWAQSTTPLFDGTQTVTMGVDDVVYVRDTLMEANVPTYFRAVPALGQNVELLLHAQIAGTTSPIQGRQWAVETGSAAGLGGAEAVVHTSSAIEYGGLVLLNKEGAGTVTIYRDTTAPSGSVAINGGAASTASRTVTLNLASADTETGIDGMQVSVDGAIDTEPVRPYAATPTVTLPAGNGTKTVLVRFRNRAGMVTDATDTITLATAADLRVSALSNPPSTKADGATFSVTDTTANGGSATAAASTTRYYLSKDATKGAGDVLLRGVRAVPQLAAGATNRGSVTVTIPAGTAAGTYRVLACADDRKVVTESNEANNCRAATTTIKVT